MKQGLKQQNQNSLSKLDRYRSQIRKQAIRGRFQQHRRQLVGHFDFQTLKSLLQSLDTIHFPKNIDHTVKQPNAALVDMIAILEQRCHQPSFNVQAAGQNLGEGFANIFLVYGKSMPIEGKTKLLSALAYLTYYSEQSSAALLLRQEFIDFLRSQLSSLSMEDLEEISMNKMAVVLLMNLSSLQKQQFILYLAESDICNCINAQISKTANISTHNHSQYYSQSIKELRGFALRLFKNVVSALECSGLAVKLVAATIKDEVYFLQHSDRMFKLLEQAMRIDHFWVGLMQSEASDLSVQYIAQAAISIQERCASDEFLKNSEQTLSETEQHDFHALLGFINKLNFQDEQDCRITLVWSKFVEELLNGYMLAEFTKRAHIQKDIQGMRVALTTYCHLSRCEMVTGSQLIIVRPADDAKVLLAVLTDEGWTVSNEVGCQCWQILKNLLAKVKAYRKQLMELKIVDRMSEVLESESAKPSLMVKVILFGRELLSAFDDGLTEQILQIYENKKIAQRIDKLINHANQQLSQKAAMFVEAVGVELRKFVRSL